MCGLVLVRNAANEHYGGANYQLGHGTGIGIRGVEHGYPVMGGCFKVYLVHPNAKAANSLQFFGGFQHIAGNLGL